MSDKIAAYTETLEGAVTSVTRELAAWRSFADAGPAADQPLVLRRTLSLKQNMASVNANLQMKVPAVCTGFSATFQPTSNVNDADANTLALHRIPGLSSVQVLFNDSTNQYITYQMLTQPEWFGRYLESFRDPRTGTNAASLNNIFSNDVFGLGLDFSGPIDLSNQKLSVQIRSGIAENFTAYFQFHSLITL